MPLSKRPRLNVVHRTLCLLLAWVFLVDPEVIQQTAFADSQYEQVSTFTWADGNHTIEYTYNDNGSLTSKVTTKPGDPDPVIVETVAYEYNLQNRLSKVTTKPYIDGSPADPEVVEYRYNPQGIRIEKINNETTPAEWTTYLIDPANPTGYAQVLEETTYTDDGQGGWTPASRIHYCIGDDVLAQTRSAWDTDHWTAAPTQFLLYDGHGSTRQLAGSTQTIQENYNYDGYGTLLQDSSAESNPGVTPEQDTSLLYAGEQFDASSQFYNNRARWYNPLNGLFNQVDPYSGNFQDPQSLHKYLYCHNNPVNLIDPSGLSGTLVETLSSLTIGQWLTIALTIPVLCFYLRNVFRILMLEFIVPIAQELINTGHDALIQAGVILLSKLNDFIEAAKQVLKDIASKTKTTLERLSKFKIFPVPQIILPWIFAHTVKCLTLNPAWFILTYNGKGDPQTLLNRLKVLKDLPLLLKGWSHDEFPYASTIQGGAGAMTAPVPFLENCIQGGMLGAFYRWICKGVPGTQFIVLPLPIYIKRKS